MLTPFCGPTRSAKLLPLMLLLTSTLTACGSDTTAPSPQPVSLTGTWVGTDTFTSCTGGVDPRTCGRLITGQTGAVKLALSQSGGSVTGTLTADVVAPGDTNNAFLATVVVPVTGAVAADGTLRLSGSAPIDQTTFGVESATVTNWATTLSGTDMVGQLAATIVGFSTGFGLPQTFVLAADLRLTRQS